VVYRYLETAGHAGAAIEHRTLLGRILRNSIDLRDLSLFAMFKDAHRQSKVSVSEESNVSFSSLMNE
jgi:hypothetical protein